MSEPRPASHITEGFCQCKECRDARHIAQLKRELVEDDKRHRAEITRLNKIIDELEQAATDAKFGGDEE